MWEFAALPLTTSVLFVRRIMALLRIGCPEGAEVCQDCFDAGQN
jgi:hypothetical protein